MRVIDWANLLWPRESAGDALLALCASSGLACAGVKVVPCPINAVDPVASSAAASSEEARRRLGRALAATAGALGVELVPVAIPCIELMDGAARFAPALIHLKLETGAEGYGALLKLTARHATLLTPMGARARIPAQQLWAALTARVCRGPARLVDDWLARARIRARRRARARRPLLELLLGERTIEGVWLLRRNPGAPFAATLARAGWIHHALVFLAAALLDMAFTTLAWVLIGRAALRRELDPSWLEAWVLCLLSALPFRLLTQWAAGRAGVLLATLLKRRLLAGALQVDPELMSARGTGGLLAMVSESEAIERAGLDGTFSAAAASIQLVGAAVALALGAGGALSVALLGGLCAAFAFWAQRTASGLATWTERRFRLSQMFVEHVQGQRTRVVQDLPERWHAGEDAALGSYASAGRSLDRLRQRLAIVPPRAWLAIGTLGLVPALWSAPGPEQIALSLGGILQAQRAFLVLSHSLDPLLTAFVAWRSVGPLFRAAVPVRSRPVLPLALDPAAVATRPATSGQAAAGAPPGDVLELRAVNFHYSHNPRLALRDCNLRIGRGERWLLEGASGSGKSTLAGIATGLYAPSAGRVLLGGFDQSLFDAKSFRQRISSAPQFHQNHLLSAPLSFNLLMGRGWPASEADLDEARDLCRALGLGPLLERMPAGIQQIVGETGWQLSHGERSRVFLARALLQPATLTVLDESFGALDPETLQQCMRVARERAATLLVIAHP